MKPKDELERLPITIGGYVTIDDDSDTVKPYIVAGLENGKATIYGLALTEECDDIIAEKLVYDINELIGIDDSFVNVYGSLWKMRDNLLNGIPFNVREPIPA